MEKFDLGIAYVWEYDEDFVNLIEKILHESNITTFRISYHNIDKVTSKIESRELQFNCFLDRASDVEPEFEPLAKMLTRRKTQILNPYKNIRHAIDKASMHLEFITAGLIVPYSIIIPPHNEKKEIYISLDDLAILGRPFIIKPCNTTGGGIGVVTGAETLKEVFEERVTNLNDKYILQQKIYPSVLDGKRTWFRCFWAFGKAILTWWDDQTHIYSEITNDEINNFGLKKMYAITKTIAKITELDFFSTEIVLTDENKFIVIDYVNDQCDMRFKSKHIDGVPNNIVHQIVDNLRNKVLGISKSTK
jgi:hypothetical protein